MTGLIMLQQHIPAKVTYEVPYYGMNVIGIVLNIIILNDQGRPLYAIVMRIADARLPCACPRT